MSKRTLLHLSPPVDLSQEPPRKQRKAPVTAKSLGLSKNEFAPIRPSPLRKHLKTFVKTLTVQLEAGDADNLAAQTATASAWFRALSLPLQAVLDIGVGKGLAFAQCQEMLRIISDSWRDINACPTHVRIAEMIENCSTVLELPWGASVQVCVERGTVVELCGYVWKMLLRTAANGSNAHVEEDLFLFQAIKDAADNGVALWGAEADENESTLDLDEADEVVIMEKPGRIAVMKSAPPADRLRALVNMKEKWANLPSTIKTFRKREVSNCRKK